MEDLDSEQGDSLDWHLQQILQEDGNPPAPSVRHRFHEDFATRSGAQSGFITDAQMEHVIKQLDRVPTLKSLVKGEKIKMARSMTERVYSKDDVIIVQGDIGDSFYVLYDGVCRILVNGMQVGEYVACPIKGTAHFFGERALLKDEPRAATISVVSPVARVLKMEREIFNTTIAPLEEITMNNTRYDSDISEDAVSGASPHENIDILRYKSSQGIRASGQNDSRASAVGAVKSQSKRIEDKLWSLGMSREQWVRISLVSEHEARQQMQYWPQWRILAHGIKRNPLFEVVAVAAVVANMVSLALAVSMPQQDRLAALICSQICKFMFFAELFVRLAGSPWAPYWLLNSPHLVIDIVVALVGLGEVCCYLIADNDFDETDATKAARVRLVVAVMQAIRLYRVLIVLEDFLPPLQMMAKAIADGLVNVTSAAFFVGIIWLTSSMFFCILIESSHGEHPEDVQIAAQRFNSVGSSLLTIIEITTGGMCWGKNVVNPLMESDFLSHKLGGMGMFILMLITTFCVWNLVLGVYVRQIVMITVDNEIELEMYQVHEGEEKVRWVKKILEDADVDKDGSISRRELKRSLAANDQALKDVGLDMDQLETLHSSMDVENMGKVQVEELLFGVLKLKGLSKTLDMLSIDFRQKMLHRGILTLETSCYGTLDTLAADLDLLQAHLVFLHEKVIELCDSMSKARADVWAEIHHLRRVTSRMHRFAIQNQQLAEERRKQKNLELRHRYEVQIDMLQAQVDRMSQERNMAILAMAGPKDIQELRRTVQQRLDTEVGPWLEMALVEAAAG